LQKAIKRARRYIYIEDQYLWYAKLGTELFDALTANPELRVIIVLDGSTTFIAPEYYARGDRARYLVLRPLHDNFPNRVHVFTLAISHHMSTAKIYKLHSKLIIVDDIFATVGSANMGQRSMTHDSELNVFVLDGRIEDGARKFARDLRIRLWAEHLGLYDAKYGMSVPRLIMGDLDRAITRLVTTPNTGPYGSRLVPYDYSLGAGTAPLPEFETLLDPDGSTPP
jgi:phosphatidylserine/phosphatidylglycerophosphate/cardiolipin synthase-like enzyme